MSSAMDRKQGQLSHQGESAEVEADEAEVVTRLYERAYLLGGKPVKKWQDRWSTDAVRKDDSKPQ